MSAVRKFVQDVVFSALSLAATAFVCASASGALSRDAYVTDGLVANWDMLDNAGTGAFVAKTNRWYDTVDASRYWTLGGSCSNASASGSLEIPSGSTCSFTGTMPHFNACEACMRWDAGRKFFNNLSTNGLIFTQTGGFGREARYMSASFSAIAGRPDTFVANLRTYVYYRNGCDLGRYQGFELQQNQVNGGNSLGGRFNKETYFKGGVYALRLYNRALTADEAKRNAVVDGIRFLGRALPDGWRDQDGRLQARLSFDLASGVTVSTGGTTLATSAPVWLDAGTEVTATVTPGSGQYAVWNGAPLDAVLAADGHSLVFTLHAPRKLECELITPDLVWEGTVTKVNYSNDTATVYLPTGTVSGTAVWAKRLVLGGRGAPASLTLTKGVTLSDRLDVNRNATLSICTESGATNGVTVRTGGKITHAVNGGTKANDYRVDLKTDGTITVEEGGSITGDSCGYKSNDSSTWTDGLESLTEPSTSGWAPVSNCDCTGGGVIRLQADVLRADGRITANGGHGSSYYGGSAGSVWITAGTFSGIGILSCDGGEDYHNGYAGTGGRISVRLTRTGAGFSDFTGRISAFGGANYQYTISGDTGMDNDRPAGTVFLETGDGHRTLVVRNGGIAPEARRKVTYPGVRFPAGEKLTVDDVVVTNAAILSLVSGADLTVRGNVRATTGGITSAADARVTFAEASRSAVLAGSQNYGSLVCTTPGKRLVFEGGCTYTLTAGGAFTIEGSEENPVELLPSSAGTFWSLTVLANVAREVKYAAVSNSLALSGLSVTDQGGTNLGGNDGGWSFVDIIEPGAAMRWTGAVSSDWKNAGNWSPAREPIATDFVTIAATKGEDEPVTNFPVIDSGVGTPAVARLTVNAGAMLTVNGGGLVVTNLLAVASGGALTVANGETITVSGDLVFGDASVFVPGNGRVILTGDLTQQVDAGGGTFNRL